MSRNAFTLIELVIVVITIAILAAIAVPSFQNKTEQAEQSAFVETLRVFVDAAHLFRIESGDYPADYLTGTLGNDGFEDYVSEASWTAPTPIGGFWDSERSSYGITAGIGVFFKNGSPKSDDYMSLIDGFLDDGDISSGSFRRIAENRFYFVLDD